MAFIALNRKSLEHNYLYLSSIFTKNKIDWAPVLKLLCGNELFINEVLKLGKEQVCDSRISNIKIIKKLDPKRETIYIKPPPKSSIKNVIRYADVSFNTETETIILLNNEAERQNKIHRIIIMIELGDLREGIMHEYLEAFYEKIFQLKNIEVAGIGSNLNCLNGIMPNKDKLIQLCLYAQLIEAKFKTKIAAITGGTSVTLPLLLNKQIPQGINHFRVGESLFFGKNLFDGSRFEKMKDDVLILHAEIIEITEKPSIPYGELGLTPSGEQKVFDLNEVEETQKRAILDIGLLDIGDTMFLSPKNKSIEIIDGSSDMIVVSISKSKKSYKVGDTVRFEMDYMGALRVMNSYYIEKRVL